MELWINMFSKACEYALKTMIYMASLEEDKKIGVKEIATAIDSPEAFTAKILQQLVRSGLLKSNRGPHGGFRLPDRPTTLLEIVTVMDGEGIVQNCVLGLEECSDDHPCPAHDRFIGIRDQLMDVLSSTALSEMKDEIISGKRFLRI